jgi:hypothetical protein
MVATCSASFSTPPPFPLGIRAGHGPRRARRPAVILDLVEKPDDVGSPNVIDLPCAELRINQPGKGALPV